MGEAGWRGPVVGAVPGLTWVSDARSRMGSKSPGNTSQPPAFFSKLTESNSAMVKSKKQEINKKLNTHNRNEPEYSKGPPVGLGGALADCPPQPFAPHLGSPGRSFSLP